MYIAKLAGHKRFELEEVDIPEVGPEDVLIQVKTCGLCTGELHVWSTEVGGYPRFLGHEVVGVVVEVGQSVSDIQVGDRVSAINDHSGFAEYCKTEARRVVKVPDGIPLDVAIGEPIACAVNAARRIRPDFQDTVVLVGCGFMGLLLAQCLRVQGVKRIIAVDTRQEALDHALRFGADFVINASTEDARKTVSEATGGQGADIVIEATGTQAGLSLCGDIVRIRGHLVIYGYHQGGLREIDVAMWNWKGLDVTNAHERDPNVYVSGMKAGLDLVAQGKLNIRDLVTHRFKLSDIDEAFAFANSKPSGYIKATVDIQ